MANTGTAQIDFGAWPGSNEASVVVTGQGSILSTSNIDAFFMGSDITSGTSGDHTALDHVYAPCFVKLTCGSVVVGTGFTIFARCPEHSMIGTFIVHWVWS